VNPWETLLSLPLTFWLLGSVLSYAVGNWLRWGLRTRDLLPAPYRGWPEQVARFLFFLGIPYLALGGWPRPPFSGLLSRQDLGLAGFEPAWPAIRWLGAVGAGLGLGVAAGLILLLAWLHANRPAGAGRLRFPPRPWWALLLDGLYLQVHWAFYRGALAVVLDDPHTAAFLGLGLITLEWGLNPFWREGWRAPLGAGRRWLRAALALVTAVIFLLTRNLWVCLGVHWLLELLFARLGRDRLAAR